MPETINAGEIPIVSVFDDKYRFEIPDYQRPYSWTSEQAGELLDDLLYASQDIGSIDSVNDHSPYFLGSIVIIKGGDMEPRAEVVDGQQRITTLTILFCALRELASPMSGYLDRRVQEESDPIAGVSGSFRLAVRRRDRDFFQNHIQESGNLRGLMNLNNPNLSDSQMRMFENAKHLWEEVSKISEDRRDVLAAFIVRRCFLVVVATTDQASAYRIFAVMNDRGLDLSPTDILKAQIIGGMEQTSREKYTAIWEDIEEEAGRDGFRDIFTHIRMIRLKTKLRGGTLQQAFQDNILKGADGAEFIDRTLAPYAEVWEDITRASYESASGADAVNRTLSHLNRLDNSDWIPPVMAFFKKNRDDANSLMRFLRDLERLAYGMFLMRTDVNGRIRRYGDVLRSIESGADLFADSSSLQLATPEKAAILAILDGQIYDRNRLSRVGRPLLLRLDSLLASAGADYNHPIISIEHVLPQNPAGGSEWTANFSQEERGKWTGKLANLVLLSRRKNSSARNHDFERKKKAYFTRNGVSPFALTTQVLAEPKWTPAVLERRQRNLIDALRTEWRLG